MGNSAKIPESFHIDISAFYNAIVNSTEDYIYIIDMTTNLAFVSDNMYKDFCLPGNIVENLIETWCSFIHEKDKQRYLDSIDEMLSGKTDQHNVEYQIKNRENEFIWIHCRGQLTRDEKNNPVMFAGVITPISGKGKFDRTTGLLSQEECKRKIELLLDHGSAKGGFLLLGLDDFGRLNSLKNHIFGDTVLREIAQALLQIVPAKASVYRFDGDEMGIFLPGACLDDMVVIYRKIYDYLNREHESEGMVYFLSVSGGIAMLGEDAQDYLDLIKCAKSALDVSKRNGKSKCTVFSSELLKENMYMADLLNQLQRSVINHMEGFSLVYQPFVNANGLNIRGAEALLRWSSPEYGNVGPAEFIPLLESCGSILPVGTWVLEQAFQTCKEWISYYPDFIMNVNVSYLQAIDKGFVHLIEQLLNKYELPAKHVVLELTESYFVTEMLALKETFRNLRKLGVCLAMDDFGTGYSSLGLLSQVPADIIKIDRIFISFINDDEHVFNRSFIDAVIKLCHSVGITVCVEGVEYIDELNVVQDMDADSIQGYYISKPITKEMFELRYCRKMIYGQHPGGM